MENKIPPFLLTNATDENPVNVSGKQRLSFADRTIRNAAKSLRTMYAQAESASSNSFLCRLNPLVIVVSFIYLIVIISLVHHITAQFIICSLVLLLYVFSGTRILRIYPHALILAFVFGFLVFAPAILNVISPGKMMWKLFCFGKPYHLWIYNMPQEIGISYEGCRVVALLFLRVLNSVSLTLLLAYTISFARILKAFKVFFVPDTILMVISLAYKYIFILCKTIEETYFALKSRLAGNINNKSIRGLVAGRIFFIYKKSRANYEQTCLAMISRGYAGKIILADENRLGIVDIIILALVVTIGALFLFCYK